MNQQITALCRSISSFIIQRARAVFMVLDTDTASWKTNLTASCFPDNSEQLEVILTMERKELRLYSVWEQQEMEAQELYLKCGVEPSPPAILLLCVSQTAAAAVQQQLCKLCVKYDEATNPGERAHTVVHLKSLASHASAVHLIGYIFVKSVVFKKKSTKMGDITFCLHISAERKVVLCNNI